MPTINTLAHDILQLGKGSINISEDSLAKFGVDVALKLQRATEERTRPRPPKTLYMSEMGTPCAKQLWYKVHKPELAEPMQGNTLLKFLYGDLIEETVLCLAKAAGHTVEMEQRQMSLMFDDWKVNGRIDAVIDGVLVDVKSCSPFGFKKFKEGLNDKNDSFGYRTQIESYDIALEMGAGKQVVKQMGFLAVDKQNGSVHFSEHVKTEDVIPKLHSLVRLVEHPKLVPVVNATMAPIPEGKSGNMKLCTVCSYCAFKEHCWKGANGGEGLRAYAYSTGPVFLTDVVKEPNVPRIALKNTGV